MGKEPSHRDRGAANTAQKAREELLQRSGAPTAPKAKTRRLQPTAGSLEPLKNNPSASATASQPSNPTAASSPQPKLFKPAGTPSTRNRAALPPLSSTPSSDPFKPKPVLGKKPSSPK